MNIDIKKIYVLCAKKGITQRQFLQTINAGTDFMTRLKKGCSVNSKTLGKVAAALDCDPEELLKDEV